ALIENLEHLPASRAVDACIGYCCLPLQQVVVLLLEAGEGPTLQGVLLDIAHAPFDLPLMPWGSRPGRQQDRSVMLAEAPQLRIQIRVVAVRADHGGLEVVGN